MNPDTLDSLVEDPAVENPRWTRCRYALGREPKAYEFIAWNGRCWDEFCKFHSCKNTDDLAAKFYGLGEDVRAGGGSFDSWQRAGVLAGQWKTL
jgi:hypothetical protein